MLRANIVLVLDELNTARLEIEDAVLHEVYWDNYLRRETWDNVKEPLLRERGFQPAYELTRDAYRAIDKANQRVYSAAETYDFRIQRRHEISFLRKTLKQIEAAEGALKAFLWARDWPGL